MDESSVEDDLSVLDAPDGGDEQNNGDSGSSEQPAEQQPDAGSRRWTCEACGCNTNIISDDTSEAERTCSVCGTSQSSGKFSTLAQNSP